ncbi:MAG: hypothetical protein IT572_04955 [Deltaproteobacteria bacterium]|nr:hypothetical protein [Deltaproteobacteria bacterium]
MSSLRVFVDNTDNTLQMPATAACAEAPPAVPARGPRPADACRITLPLTLDVPNPPTPRQIAFDRQGDQFVLSTSNSAENLTWVGSHQNLPSALDVARLTGALLRSAGRPATASRYAVGFFVWISRYVLTGRVAFDAVSGGAERSPDIEGILLELFTGSRAQGLVPLVGNINLLRRDANLPAETRERIERVTRILDLVPTYQAFLRHFVTEAENQGMNRISGDDLRRYGRVITFVRNAVVTLANRRPLRYDAATLEAHRAYSELRQADIAAGTRPDFCAALNAALQERGSVEAPVANFVNECRLGIEWGARPAVEAMRESLRFGLVGASGLPLLQRAIAEESAAANMRLEWLGRRSSFGQVFAALRDNVGLSGEGEAVRLTFDVGRFRQALRLMTSLTARGEYDLSALAFLRRLFGGEGDPPPLRVFADGHFREVEWQIPRESLRQVRELISSLAGRRSSSDSFAVHGMPAILGATCALGTGGIVLSHAVPAIAQNRGLQMGLGTASSGLAGGGCFGLAGHYVWPAAVPRAVHNRYAWDLGSAAVGTGLGIGAYLLINLFSGGNPAGANPRFPVDPYGP